MDIYSGILRQNSNDFLVIIIPGDRFYGLLEPQLNFGLVCSSVALYPISWLPIPLGRP